MHATQYQTRELKSSGHHYNFVILQVRYTFSTFFWKSVETHTDETPRYDKTVCGILATKFAWNKGESIIEGNIRHIYVLNCSVFQVNKA
jgi:hypothetical protein